MKHPGDITTREYNPAITLENWERCAVEEVQEIYGPRWSNILEQMAYRRTCSLLTEMLTGYTKRIAQHVTSEGSNLITAEEQTERANELHNCEQLHDLLTDRLKELKEEWPVNGIWQSIKLPRIKVLHSVKAGINEREKETEKNKRKGLRPNVAPTIQTQIRVIHRKEDIK